MEKKSSLGINFSSILRPTQEFSNQETSVGHQVKKYQSAALSILTLGIHFQVHTCRLICMIYLYILTSSCKCEFLLTYAFTPAGPPRRSLRLNRNGRHIRFEELDLLPTKRRKRNNSNENNTEPSKPGRGRPKSAGDCSIKFQYT